MEVVGDAWTIGWRGHVNRPDTREWGGGRGREREKLLQESKLRMMCRKGDSDGSCVVYG